MTLKDIPKSGDAVQSCAKLVGTMDIRDTCFTKSSLCVQNDMYDQYPCLEYASSPSFPHQAMLMYTCFKSIRVLMTKWPNSFSQDCSNFQFCPTLENFITWILCIPYRNCIVMFSSKAVTHLFVTNSVSLRSAHFFSFLIFPKFYRFVTNLVLKCFLDLIYRKTQSLYTLCVNTPIYYHIFKYIYVCKMLRNKCVLAKVTKKQSTI